MIKNNVYYEFFASYTMPNPDEVGYWVDLGANSKGKIIKVYNPDIKAWVKITDATSEDAVSPFIGSNGNWWIDNRDTGIPATGKNPYIGSNYNWYVYDPEKLDYVDTGVPSKGKSAYDLAVDYGFNGTEKEWVESLSKPSLDAASAAFNAANKANDAAERAENAADDANEASDLANNAADRAEELADNPPKVIDNMWYTYDFDLKKYVSTGITAMKNPMGITRSYSSEEEMYADFNNPDVQLSDIVIINTDDVEDPENARLYLKGDSNWIFITDLSGSQGIKGESAYQLAVQHGFIGTESEWVQSLKQPALDAAEQANNAISTISALQSEIEIAEENRSIAEESRADSEKIRINNENERIRTESLRATSEVAREHAEIDRTRAENIREDNEDARIQNEEDRVENELLRQSDENVRDSKEAIRQYNEQTRINSENARIAKENSRVEAEKLRESKIKEIIVAEESRVEAESNRNSQESIREKNETIREANETDRQNNITSSINSLNEAKKASEQATTNANVAASNANVQAKKAEELANHPPTIVDNYWYVWSTELNNYTNTGFLSTGTPGESPKIIDGTWWIFDNNTGKYSNTNISVSSDYVLTKEKIENVFTGDIITHTHDKYYLRDAPKTGNQYVRQSGEWKEVVIPEIDLSNYLSKDNVEDYEPTSDYNPATKKYVDDTVAAVDVTDQISGKADKTYVDNQLDTKVDKITGKGLSTNDYTTAEKDKLAGIETGAEVNVNADWNATSGDAQILNKPTIITESQVDQKISAAVGSVYKIKGTIANYESLPTENVTVGDVYNIEDTGANYVAIEINPSIVWDKLSETVDLSGYLTKTDAGNTYLSKNDATTTYQPKGDYLTSIPSEYVTDTELTAKDFATTSEVNAKLTNYSTTIQMNTAISAATSDKLDSSAYTAADVLTKVKTVDGADSGLDADLLDGKQGSEYALKTDIPELITVDTELSITSTNPVQNKTITTKVNELITNISNADEIYISDGIEPTGNEEVWVDLSDDSFDDIVVTEAPKDDKQYARKNGEWVVVEGGGISGETVKIKVISNQAQPDNAINSVTITLEYGNNTKEFVWEGSEITTDVPMNMTYTITCSDIEGYATPEVQEYIAMATNTRNVTLAYNTTITTITVTSNNSTLFPTQVGVNLGSGLTKSLSGALVYTINIPTGTKYTVSGQKVLIDTEDSYREFDTPEQQTITATGVTQDVVLLYRGTKVTVNVTSDEGIIEPTISLSSLWSHTITSGVEKVFVLPANATYTFSGSDITNYITPAQQSIVLDETYSDKVITIAYTFLAEDAYAMWVEFDDTTPTTVLNRGGNLDVITSLTSKFKRCLALPQNDGTAAIAYLNANNSNKWEDGTEIAYSGDFHYVYFMVHFPKYYYRCEQTSTDKWKLYISEKQINDNYKEEKECLIGVFEAYNTDGKLTSRINTLSTASQTITSFFNQARANGSNWGLIDYRAHKTIANMFCAKYGNTNISTKNSSIPCSGGTKAYDSGYTGSTMSLGNNDGLSNTSSNFLGLEDCYYGKWEFVQGINIISRNWIVYDGGLNVDKGINELISAGYTNIRNAGTGASANNYITKISHGEYADVVPVAVSGGSDTTYYADYYWQNTGNRIFLRSGSSGDGSYCGVFVALADSDSSGSHTNFGSRLGFYGDIVIKTKDEFLALEPGFNG